MLAGLLAGCAHPSVPPQLVLGRTNCDAALVLADPAPVKFDPQGVSVTEARIGNPGRCVLVADADGDFYASFALPRTTLPYTLSVGAIPQGLALLAPEVRLVNERGEVTRSFTVDRFLFRANQLTVLLQPRPDETGMIVLSDHKLVGQKLARIQENLVTTLYNSVGHNYGALGALQYGTDAVAETTFSFEGALKISTLPQG